jgi:hypothetical protein
MEDFGIEALVALIPAHWWVTIGTWFAYALAALLCVHGALAALYRFDGLDGRRDWPRVSTAYRASVAVLNYALAVVEMLPVQLPFVRGLERLRDLRRAPHPDDVRVGR